MSDSLLNQLQIFADYVASRRTAEIDGEALQRMYEKWLKTEQWQPRAHAVPLLFAVDPEQWSDWLKEDDLRRAEASLWDALSAEFGDQQSVTPQRVYQMARRIGYSVPEPYERLIQFISSVVKGPEPEPADEPAQASARERLLGAAFNILSKWPERCRDANGMIAAEPIVDLIESQPALWFDASVAPLARREMVDLLNRWLD